MNVLMNALSAHRGGIFTYTRNLARFVENRGLNFRIAASPALAAAIGEQVMSIDVSGLGAVRRLLWEQIIWRRIVREADPDVLFSSANFALLGCPVPQLLLMREGGLFNPYYLAHIYPTLGPAARIATILRRKLMIRSIRTATRVMFPSETLRDWVAGWEPAVAEYGVVNQYGVDLQRFEMTGPRAPLGSGPIQLLYVSVYYPHKDPCTLSRAVGLLRQGGIQADARITMDEAEFGLWSSGPREYSELQRTAGIRLGPVDYDDLKQLYNGAGIFVFPSISETFGFPLVEAMACGLPIVAADTLINREICGPVALYHAPQDATALAARIRELAARPDLYRWLSAEGRARAENKFDIRNHFSRTIDNLQTISRRKQR